MQEPTLGELMENLGNSVADFWAATDKMKSCKCSAYDFPHRKNSGKCGTRTCSCAPIIGSDGKDYGLNCANPDNCPHV